MANEKLNLNDIMKEIEGLSFTDKELEEIRTLIEKLREFKIGRREYQLPSPFARRKIRTERTEEPDPRTIKLTASHRQNP